MTPFQARASRTLDASPERVMAILRDYRTEHPAILPRPPFTALDVVEGGIGAGTVLELGMKTLGKEQRLRGVVTEPEPGRLLVESYEGPNGLVTSFTVDATNRGTNLVIDTRGRVLSKGLLGRLERWMTERMLQSVYRREIDLIAARAKGG